MIVPIVNLKGGVSKTTTAIALACAAGAAGRAVRVLDADPQGSAVKWAHAAEEAGTPLPFEVGSINMAGVLGLESDGTYTFIDCPPTGRITDAAIDHSDFVIVPTTPAPIDLAKTAETVSVLEARGILHGVLLTRVIPRTLSYQRALATLADKSTFDAHIPKREAILGAYGRPFSGELFGYDQVFFEMDDMLDD